MIDIIGHFVTGLLCLVFGHVTDRGWPWCLQCGLEVNPDAWEAIDHGR